MGWFSEPTKEERSEELNDCNRQGQLDGLNGKYDPPHSIGLGTIGSDAAIAELEEDNAAYEAGRESTRKGN